MVKFSRYAFKQAIEGQPAEAEVTVEGQLTEQAHGWSKSSCETVRRGCAKVSFSSVATSRKTHPYGFRWQSEDFPVTRKPTYEELESRLRELEKQAAERKQVEETLRQAHTELETKVAALEAANEELSQYAYISSHDLKAPLRAIRNYSDFLCEDLEAILNEEHKTCLDGLERAVRQGEELLDDLLEFSRVGIWNLSTQPIDIGVFLKELIASFDLPSNAEVVLEDHLPTIDVEPTLVTQIFEELIRNAIKFNHSARKRVEIGWMPVGEDRCELFVRDNGIGIKPRHYDQIFNMFQRLHSRLDYNGTGIGLAIVRKAVCKLHGAIRVESEPGKGSTFFVSLPTPGK
jgi:light-regulated signal transduction histidine kinase (bacteriophytochrome)